jgi:hypothetical protein
VNTYVYGQDFTIDTGVNADGSPNGFRKATGELDDPTTVVLSLMLNGQPSTIVQYVYSPISGPITRLAEGCYSFSANTNDIFAATGTDDVWSYQWASQGVIDVIMLPANQFAVVQPTMPVTF